MADHVQIEQIHDRLAPLRAALLNHPLYGGINSVGKLHLFMQHHIFAVWDFMSLLKTLQRRFCGDGVPWLPAIDQQAARLVNEIVLGEESDEDGEGGFASHFDLYHRAMRRSQASTHTIDRFLTELRDGTPVVASLEKCDAPQAVREFVLQTFEIIDSGDLCAIASAFTFGREELLPDVFQRIVDELNMTASGGLSDFQYYLSRHIELDGDHHGPMAARLISSLCGDDNGKWQIAEKAAVKSLQARQRLWDGMYDAIQQDSDDRYSEAV